MSINFMVLEEHHFFLKRSFDFLIALDSMLTSVFNSNIPKSERNFFVLENPSSISTSVHQIDLGDNSDSSDTFRVKFSCHLKSVRGS